MNFFSLNSPLARGINKLVTMLYAGILWFLCSIPIVTVGAATAALYEVLLKASRDHEGYVGAGFFKAFRANIRQGIPTGLVFLAAGVVFAVNILYYSVLDGFEVQAALFVILFLLLLTAAAYVFAVMARFENTMSGHFRMALVLMIRNPGWTVAVLVSKALELFLIWFFIYFPALFMMGIGGYIRAVIFDHIFQRLIDSGMIVEENGSSS